MDNMGNIWKYTINIAYHAHIWCSMDPINIPQSCLHIYHTTIHGSYGHEPIRTGNSIDVLTKRSINVSAIALFD